MNPNESSVKIISASNVKLDFNSDNYYKLTIGWINGKIECELLTRVRFGDKKTEYHSTKNEDELGGIEIPLNNSWSHGCRRLNYLIKPCKDINELQVKVSEGIYACIKIYERQLEEELKETKESLKLIQSQY